MESPSDGIDFPAKGLILYKVKYIQKESDSFMAKTQTVPAKTTTRDMTEGSIVRQIILFSLPLMLGNVFQMLYNTVDSIVVGNFVGTQALAAVGSTTMIVNMAVFFFNGFSIGAGVVIARLFGAKDMEKLHLAIETTMAATFILSAVFTVAGVLSVPMMLRFMSTPEDVFDSAVLYLRIYLGGISGLLIYNIGSGILRAVGDSTRPLYFLIFTSLLNIVLDLLFVIVFRMGIAGVAYATILAQFLSAAMILLLLTRTRDIYRLSWRDLTLDAVTLGQIFAVGMPTAIQSIITGFSNVFVQAYINSFGSACMAGWSSYNKLDQFVMLVIQSISMASTTFVSQNMGADKPKRAENGIYITVGLNMAVTLAVVLGLFFLAEPAVSLFTGDEAVIAYGALFIHANSFFLLCNTINHVLAGGMRGLGDSKGPMIIMLSTFVGVRQIYLYWVTHFVANTPLLVGLGYPVGWTACAVTEVAYFYFRWKRHGFKKGIVNPSAA